VSALSNDDGDPVERVQTLEAALERTTRELERLNGELGSLMYSISHDLRAPLRAITGFSEALVEDCAGQLDAQANEYLQQVQSAASRMELLIVRLMELAQVNRAELRREDIDVTAMASAIAMQLRDSNPGRVVDFAIAPALHASADPRLLRTAFEQLLGNAWKFTSAHATAKIEVGSEMKDGRTVIYVRDDGAGFNPEYAQRLFGVFQRLHSANEFPGAGTGLAMVQRIINRHGGEVWATGKVEQGATVYIAFE
jgi:light-regulated signal transduction histidine kinase (bacteriophytochrome)